MKVKKKPVDEERRGPWKLLVRSGKDCRCKSEVTIADEASLLFLNALFTAIYNDKTVPPRCR
jgi:hypothetical protein